MKGRHQVDVKVIFNASEENWDRFLMGPRNLGAAVRHYCGRELEGAHSAEADTQATVDVLLAQLHAPSRAAPRRRRACSTSARAIARSNRDDEPAGAKGRRRLGMTFRTRLRYRFGDIDDAGIAYYPKLLHYFHCAFEDWWSDGLGHPYSKLMHDDKLGLPAVKLEAEFFAPVRYGDEPWVHIGVLQHRPVLGGVRLLDDAWRRSAKPLCKARVPRWRSTWMRCKSRNCRRSGVAALRRLRCAKRTSRAGVDACLQGDVAAGFDCVDLVVDGSRVAASRQSLSRVALQVSRLRG
jgi:hypothetical protein